MIRNSKFQNHHTVFWQTDQKFQNLQNKFAEHSESASIFLAKPRSSPHLFQSVPHFLFFFIIMMKTFQNTTITPIPTELIIENMKIAFLFTLLIGIACSHMISTKTQKTKPTLLNLKPTLKILICITCYMMIKTHNINFKEYETYALIASSNYKHYMHFNDNQVTQTIHYQRNINWNYVIKLDINDIMVKQLKVLQFNELITDKQKRSPHFFQSRRTFTKIAVLSIKYAVLFSQTTFINPIFKKTKNLHAYYC